MVGASGFPRVEGIVGPADLRDPLQPCCSQIPGQQSYMPWPWHQREPLTQACWVACRQPSQRLPKLRQPPPRESSPPKQRLPFLVFPHAIPKQNKTQHALASHLGAPASPLPGCQTRWPSLESLGIPADLHPARLLWSRESGLQAGRSQAS